MVDAAAPVIWFHVPHEGSLPKVEELALRLETALPDADVVITANTLPAQREKGAIRFLPAPAERRSDAARFFQECSPSVLLWVGGDVQPVLVAEADAQGVPHYLLDVRAGELKNSRVPWQRLRQKSLLRSFDRVLAVDAAAAEDLRFMGARPWQIETSGGLEEGTVALAHSEAERADLAEELASRPIWYAPDLPMEELALALRAHGHAIRRAHRFLCVIGAAEASDGTVMAEMARAKGFRVVQRSVTDEIDSEDQVLIADLPDEYGLWYRLAPLCYLGGTFMGLPNRNPFEPAALGSAVLHGPHPCFFAPNFDALSAAGASRVLQVPEELGPALVSLSAPDQCAQLAHAAWDVSSQGAEVTDRVIGLIRRAVRDGA